MAAPKPLAKPPLPWQPLFRYRFGQVSDLGSLHSHSHSLRRCLTHTLTKKVKRNGTHTPGHTASSATEEGACGASRPVLMPASRDVRLGEMSCPVCIGVYIRVHVWVCARMGHHCCVPCVGSFARRRKNNKFKVNKAAECPLLSFIRGGCTRGRPQRRDTCRAGNITRELVEYLFCFPTSMLYRPL
jgi:hypothetical protein